MAAGTVTQSSHMHTALALVFASQICAVVNAGDSYGMYAAAFIRHTHTRAFSLTS